MGCFPSDKLPSNPPTGACLIANYSPSDDGGSHWVGMKNLNTHNVEYFDSYGFEPDSEDMIISVETNFKQYLKSNSTNGKYDYSNMNIQNLKSDVCGEYCCKFIRDGLPIKKGRLNQSWKKYVQSNSTHENDKNIRQEIKIRHI